MGWTEGEGLREWAQMGRDPVIGGDTHPLLLHSRSAFRNRLSPLDWRRHSLQWNWRERERERERDLLLLLLLML